MLIENYKSGNQTNMKKLIWRLSHLPDPMELQGLVKDGIMTKEEAREILFKHEDDTEPTTESLKSEVKFLRGLVDKLSSGNTTKIVEYIYSKPYNSYWYTPYQGWCSAVSYGSGVSLTAPSGSAGVCNTAYYSGTGSTVSSSLNDQLAQFTTTGSSGDNIPTFSSISTF